MKIIKTLSGFLMFTAAFALVAGGQTTPAPSSSLLYEIRGKNLKQPSYLFGTLHAGCAADLVPVESLAKYLGATSEMLMELDLDNPAELQSMAASVVIPDGKTLADYLTPAELAKVDMLIEDYMGIPGANFRSINPTMLAVMIMTSAKVTGCAPVATELKLVEAAAAQKKPVTGLETVQAQTAIINSKPMQKQAKDLYDMAADPEKAIREFKALLEAYRARNADKLYETASMQIKADEAAFYKRLLDDRNIAWMSRIESSMTSKPTFIAVGAAHLGGNNGLVKLLRAKGYTVVPVKL